MICKDKLSLCTPQKHKGLASRPGRFIRGNIHPYPMNRRLCGALRPVQTFLAERKNLPSERVANNRFYARRLYVKPKGQNSATHRYSPDCINALVPKESTCSLRTTALLPRTWRVADQAPNVHVLAPMPILMKDKSWTTKRTEQPVAAELRNSCADLVKWRQTKQTALETDLLVYLFLVR